MKEKVLISQMERDMRGDCKDNRMEDERERRCKDDRMNIEMMCKDRE